MSNFEERMQMRSDLFSGRIPKRVLVSAMFTLEAACSHANIPLIEAHYDRNLAEKAYAKVCEDFYSDTIPALDMRFPAVYQMLGAKNWIVGSNGAVQHPEIENLKASEYDEFIEDPDGFIIKTLLPRVCTALDTDPENKALNFAKAYSAYNQSLAKEMDIAMRLSMQYGYCPGFLGPLVEAPFDFLSDQLRGFKGISMDIRRIPDKVEKAVNAILPIMMRCGIPTVMNKDASVGIPLHLAPYLRTEDFHRLYWPSLYKLIVDLDDMGIRAGIFAEQDWTRYSSYLETLPESTSIMFEDGDYKKLKATAGKKHLITGFYDPTHTLNKTKEECIDEVKSIIDVCAPLGRFYFSFNRGIMDIKSVNVSNLQAVLEWVHVNTDY